MLQLTSNIVENVHISQNQTRGRQLCYKKSTELVWCSNYLQNIYKLRYYYYYHDYYLMSPVHENFLSFALFTPFLFASLWMKNENALYFVFLLLVTFITNFSICYTSSPKCLSAGCLLICTEIEKTQKGTKKEIPNFCLLFSVFSGRLKNVDRLKRGVGMNECSMFGYNVCTYIFYKICWLYDALISDIKLVC